MLDSEWESRTIRDVSIGPVVVTRQMDPELRQLIRQYRSVSHESKNHHEFYASEIMISFRRACVLFKLYGNGDAVIESMPEQMKTLYRAFWREFIAEETTIKEYQAAKTQNAVKFANLLIGQESGLPLFEL